MPGLLAIILARIIDSDHQPISYLFFAFVATGVLDAGHVYGTVWRTYLNAKEVRRLRLYLFLPIALFLIFFLWLNFSLPLLGAFVVYATIFHNIRQFFGINKWYQKLNGQFSKASDYFVYLLCFIPFVAFHFRSFPPSEFLYYSDEGTFFHPSHLLLQITFVLYGVVLFSWIVFEFLRLKKYGDWNRSLSVLIPGIIYGFSFISAKNEAEVVFPLVAAHGAAYFALSALALKRTQSYRFSSFTTALIGFSLVAFIFGSIEFEWGDPLTESETPFHDLYMSLFLTPLFCHYIFDMFLWTRHHPESKMVFAKSTEEVH